ncbi:pyridoxamine 5'-phosphate oxidase [Methylobacterium sp. Leaf456]|uniref:pyridoxamine 5'-phosphate oxidase family protein n=1 Tax=Methylobacterium sp. Leaf456 TaxID=1736382 RepID=UPI0006F42500|nr:pyridoxamine 5'-phosphate oxidase family protein [Methylobacterium sp. Leaf456]KQT55069.1 pyridoxamine 5'-phosphate oxidase [Methylobacterium sp. Leaf456]
MDRTPWHGGEVALQTRAGSAGRMAEIGPRVIRDHLIEQHAGFYPLLPFVVLGTVDAHGAPWATLRAGPPGSFLGVPDPHHLTVAAAPEPDDPAEEGLHDGAGVGLLGIELETRRRNRLNGTVERRGENGFTVAVEQSFGNCPRYIRPRPAMFSGTRRKAQVPTVSDRLDGRARALLAATDTLFVASYTETAGQTQVDVSHRGGPAGFVRVADDGTLTVPDYAGNHFFNTLGNLLSNPRAGIAVPDFASGDLLQITGRTELVLDSPEIADFEGAERLWRLVPEQVVFRAGALPLRFGAA